MHGSENIVVHPCQHLKYTEGNITFEADGFFRGKPDELLPDCAKLMAATGKLLVNKVQNYKK